MPLAQLRAPFDHPDWLFEVKYDGFRALACLEGGTVRLVSRKGNTYKSLPALCRSLAACMTVSDAVLDGEIVYLGPDGKPQFYDLMRRRGPQYFYAFDLLWLNGRDQRGLPLLERKRRLREIVPRAPSPLLYVDHVVGAGVDLFEAVGRNDLEGIVAKRADARYTPEEPTCVKIKSPTYSQIEGRQELFEKRRPAAR
jgi:bifunctional non-homologous end joining protein LigD